MPDRGPPACRPRGRPVTGGQYRNRREIRLRVDWCCSRGSKRPPSLRTRSWHTGTAWNGTEHWNTRLCQPPAPRHRGRPSPRRRRRSTPSARAVRTRRSPRPAPGPFTHRPTLAHLGTLAHPGTPVPTAGVPGSANSNRLKVRLRRFPAPTAEVISGLAHWHTCISFFY